MFLFRLPFGLFYLFFSTKTLYPFLFTPIHAIMPNQPHFPLFYHPKIILWIMTITKFCFVSFSAVARYIPPLTPTHLPQHSIIEHSQPMSPSAICFMFTHICFIFNGTAVALWCIKNLMTATVKWDCLFLSCIRLRLSYPAVFTRVTSYLDWIQTLAMWLLDWHQSTYK
jgi:hypothetical protein